MVVNFPVYRVSKGDTRSGWAMQLSDGIHIIHFSHPEKKRLRQPFQWPGFQRQSKMRTLSGVGEEGVLYRLG
jgi:hypothetical protein